MPQAKLVDGYQPLMPTFQGLVSEESVMALVEYVKSLRNQDTASVESRSTRGTREADGASGEQVRPWNQQ